MRFIAWNMALVAWLLLSAFALSRSGDSAALTGLLAVLIGTFALAAPGLRGLRFVNAILALVLAGSALLLPELSGLARVSDAMVAAAVFALSLVPGRSTSTEQAAEPAPPSPKP